MSYGMDGWNHDNDLVRRKDVMDSMVKEYNRRFSLGERNGLKLAWIEKAVNEVDVAQQGKTQLPEEDATKGATSDLISRAAAIDDLHGKDPSQIWDTADIEVWVNALPSAQPDEEKISDILYSIYRNTSPHTSADGVVAIKYYIREIYREVFGEEGPKWLKK